MKLFAWLSRWTRTRHKPAEDSAELSSTFDADHSSMAELVRILTQIDRGDGARAPR